MFIISFLPRYPGSTPTCRSPISTGKFGFSSASQSAVWWVWCTTSPRRSSDWAVTPPWPSAMTSGSLWLWTRSSEKWQVTSSTPNLAMSVSIIVSNSPEVIKHFMSKCCIWTNRYRESCENLLSFVHFDILSCIGLCREIYSILLRCVVDRRNFIDWFCLGIRERGTL